MGTDCPAIKERAMYNTAEDKVQFTILDKELKSGFAIYKRPKLKDISTTIKKFEVSHIVSLLTPGESPDILGKAIVHCGANWIYFNVSYFAGQPFDSLIEPANIIKSLIPFCRVLIHCSHGMNRSPSATYMALRLLQYEKQEALTMVLDSWPACTGPLKSTQDRMEEYMLGHYFQSQIREDWGRDEPNTD
jgi:hypothetical protein